MENSVIPMGTGASSYFLFFVLVVLSVSEQSEEGRNLPGRSNFQRVFTISVVEAYMMFISFHFN